MKEPALAVDGIVLRRGDIALVYRKYEPEGWALPGGHVEEDETLEEACLREVEEETGLEVEIVEREGPSNEFGVYDDPWRDPRKRVISVVFVCKPTQGELKAGEEVDKVRFFSKEEIFGLDLDFDHEKIIKDFLDSWLADKLESP